MKRKLFPILLSLLMIGVAGAGGFELYEFGAASSALSGAVVARAWDASTIFYNPSGIAFLKDGSHFYGNLTLITASNKFTGAEPLFAGEEHEAVSKLHTPIGIFFSHQFSDDIYAGIGVTNPFGLGLAWEEDFPGRSISLSSDLKSFYISPVVAYKVSDEISVSAGADIVFGMITLERYVRMFDSEGSPGIETAKTKIEGNSDLAFGFTASAMYKTENFGVGLLYRHSVENNLNDADATFTFLDTYAKDVAMANLKDQKVSSSLTFPNFISGGIYYKFLENLGAEIDVMWYGWSVYDKLVLDFTDLPTVEVLNNYEDSWQFRIGVHYDLSEAWQLRAGYIWDQTPQPVEAMSPQLPDNDRNDVSLGVGYRSGAWNFDAGYMIVDFGERSTVVDGVGQNHDGFNGTYASVANLLFFSFGYSFE